MVGKEHKNLLADIRGYATILENSAELKVQPSDFFIESTYQDGNNQTRPCYLITRKGCDMVANKMTGEKGVLFTATYVTRFEEMEKQLNKIPQMTQIEIIAAIAQAAAEQEKALKEITAHQTQIAATQTAQAGRIEQIENKIEKRMTDEFEMQLVTPTQIGKMLEPALSGKAVNNRLRDAGLQWRVGGEWVATVEGKKYSSSDPIQLANGRMIYQLMWQRRVKEILM